MDQQRGYSDEADQRWYGADNDWERGRHGAPPAAADEAYDPTARYPGQPGSQGQPAASFFDVGPRSGEAMPPRQDDPTAGEMPRRSTEAIDVGALRREQFPAYAEPSPAYAEPPGFAAPDYPAPDYAGADYAAYPSSGIPAAPTAPAAPPAPVAPAAPVTGPPDAPGGLEGLGFGGITYQSGTQHPAQHPGPHPSQHPAGGPTAAHNTVGGTYRSRRPVVAVGVGVVAGLFEVVALRLLVDAVFTSSPSVAATASAIFLVLGLPLFALGVHGLLSGGAALTAAVNAGWRVWARPPLVYLPLGLVLFVCAALAG